MSTLEDISNLLRDLSARIFRLETRGQGFEPPTYPVHNDVRQVGQGQGPPPPPNRNLDQIDQRDSNPMVNARETYANVVQRQHHRPINNGTQPRQQPVSSTNLDFWFVINTIFNLLRLEHHRTIWSGLPSKVGYALNEFIQMISPPLPDNQWRKKMKKLEEDVESTIVLNAREHIEAQQSRLKEALGRCNPEDKEDAARLAYSRFLGKYGRKTQTRHLDIYLREILTYIGTTRTQSRPACENLSDLGEPIRPPAPTNTTRPNQTSGPTEEARVPDQPTPAPQRKRNLITTPELDSTDDDFEGQWERPRRRRHSKKSRNAEASPRDSQNTLAMLLDLQTEGDNLEPAVATEDDHSHSEELIAVEPRCNPNQNPTTPHSPKKTDPRRETSNRKNELRAHLSASQPSMKLAPTKTVELPARSQPTTVSTSNNAPDRVSPAGTSNAGTSQVAIEEEIVAVPHRSVDKSSWQVTTKPTTRLLIIGDSNLKLAKTRDSHVEIHSFSGARLSHINDILSMSTLGDSVKDIVVATGINNRTGDNNFPLDFKKMKEITSKMKQTVHFVGVSQKLSEAKEIDNIRRLNKEAYDTFGDRYITPLAPGYIDIIRTDHFRIHHEVGTVNRILDSIFKHIRQYNHLNGN